MTRQGFADDANILVEDNLDRFTRDCLLTWMVHYPFGYFIVHAPLAFLLRIWGKGSSATSRFRLYFAGLLPGLPLSVLSTFAIPFLSASALESMLVPVLGLTALAYAVTVFRGLPKGVAAARRAVWRHRHLHRSYDCVVDLRGQLCVAL
jgi:hypothetical protein